MTIDMLNTTDTMMLPLACLTLGVILGLIGGLKFAAVMSASLRQRIDELERDRISQKG